MNRRMPPMPEGRDNAMGQAHEQAEQALAKLRETAAKDPNVQQAVQSLEQALQQMRPPMPGGPGQPGQPPDDPRQRMEERRKRSEEERTQQMQRMKEMRENRTPGERPDQAPQPGGDVAGKLGDLQKTVEQLKAALEAKDKEIQALKHQEPPKP